MSMHVPIANSGKVHGQDSDGPTLIKSGLKLGHLQMLVALEDLGQVSAAAEALHMSQPAASRMVSEMEAIVRAPLCERIARGVVLTTYGAALAKRARKILLELREAGRELSELRTGRGGSVFVGAVTAPALSLVVPAVRRVTSAYPGIEINVQVETSNILARELMAARHDFILGRIPEDINPQQFHMHEIGVERACLIVRSGHPLLKQGLASLADLTRYDWVFQPPGTLLRRTLEDIFMRAALPMPANIINMTSLLLTVAVIRDSNAIAPVALDMAQFLVGQSSRAGEIRILPADFDITVKPYSLITMRERALPPSARLLYDMILEQSRILSETTSFAPL